VLRVGGGEYAQFSANGVDADEWRGGAVAGDSGDIRASEFTGVAAISGGVRAATGGGDLFSEVLGAKVAKLHFSAIRALEHLKNKESSKKT
jgi:hypothetical protein